MCALRMSVVFCLILIANSCQRQSSKTVGMSPIEELPELIRAANGAIVREEPIAFLSWGGHWQGTDIDTELTLNPDGTAILRHFGSGVDKAEGTWAVTEDVLTVDVPFHKLVEMHGATDWPKLKIKTGNGKLYLVPARKTIALEYGHGSAWPLREYSAN